jgi:DNA invertase Pin-like site-specific DNA recombinase
MHNVLNTKAIPTALYGRVSHDEQAKYGFSIGNQLDRLKEYAEKNNLVIVDQYIDEGYSAGSKKRPELQRLLGDLHRFELIIFTKLDRFTRNVLDANEMVNEFNKRGISIKAIDEDIDTSTADGMFDFNLKVSLAQRELAKGSERIKTVFEYKVKNGQPISGNVPIGFKIETNEQGMKKVVIDKEQEPFIRDFYKHFKRYHSIRAAARFCNEKYDVDRSYSFYHRLLINEMYCGAFRGNLNFCEGYMTREEWEQLQDVKNRVVKTAVSKRIYLFSALIECPVCGRKLTVKCNHKYGKKGYTRTYIYYRCPNNLLDADNHVPQFREEEIEKMLLQNIKPLAEKYIYEAKLKPEKVEKKNDDVKEILEEIDRLNYSFRKKRVSVAEYDREYEELEKRLARAKKEAPKVKDLSGIEAFLNSGWESVYENLSKEDKRALIRSVVKTMSFDENGDLTVEFV